MPNQRLHFYILHFDKKKYGKGTGSPKYEQMKTQKKYEILKIIKKKTNEAIEKIK